MSVTQLAFFQLVTRFNFHFIYKKSQVFTSTLHENFDQIETLTLDFLTKSAYFLANIERFQILIVNLVKLFQPIKKGGSSDSSTTASCASVGRTVGDQAPAATRATTKDFNCCSLITGQQPGQQSPDHTSHPSAGRVHGVKATMITRFPVSMAAISFSSIPNFPQSLPIASIVRTAGINPPHGTRKIFIVYGHFTLVPAGMSFTSTNRWSGANGL